VTTGLLELGEIMVAGAQRRLETTSHNVANLSTPGFKRRVSFQQTTDNIATSLQFSTDFAPSAIRMTGQQFDIAIASNGFFRLRGENGVYYTRSGQFARDGEGRIVDGQGLVLQTADGLDLVVSGAEVEILEDGVVIDNGAPVARLGVFEIAPDAQLERISGAYFSAGDESMQSVAQPLLRQGMLEGSNVELSAEMMTMMSAMRQAEVGARVVQTYDSLIGQTISTLGRVRA
jgi:flagellar basal-body rod protein FlgF